MNIDEQVAGTRMKSVTLRLCDIDNVPLANATVTIGQKRHKFLFGANAFCIGRFEDAAIEEAYEGQFSQLLNYATLPFYWGGYEPQPGKTDRSRLTDMAHWCRRHDILAKGHPLCWHEVGVKWLDRAGNDEIAHALWMRIEREVKDFRDSILVWDVVNEAVVMPTFGAPNPMTNLCKELGAVELIRRAFQKAREASPPTMLMTHDLGTLSDGEIADQMPGPPRMLILNDFDVSDKYEELIGRCLDARIVIDAIGIQSHMHKGYWGEEKTLEVLERFSRFGLPLHFTELTILSGRLKAPGDNDWHTVHTDWDTTPEGEQLQKEQAAQFYSLLLAHPSVAAITWWDFADAMAWQGAPAGLLRRDMSAKPAFEWLMGKVKGDWWLAPTEFTTDGRGEITFAGFAGDYELRLGGCVTDFNLDQLEQDPTLMIDGETDG
jgi:GH35 family endo-1,4-beta-xylanase